MMSWSPCSSEAPTPRDIVERAFVTDAANLTWEMLRYRRLKAHVLSVSHRNGLKGLIVNALLERELSQDRRSGLPESSDQAGGVDADEVEEEGDREKRILEEARQRAEDAVLRWNAGDEGRSEVAELLRELGLDESDIEIAALMDSRDLIEAIDRRLARLEVRRINAIRFVGEYRKAFAQRVGEVSKRLIESDGTDLQRITEPADHGK
jgi:hypothetical protein